MSNNKFFFKLLLLLALGFFVFAKSVSILHQYGHDIVVTEVSDDHDDEQECFLCEFAGFTFKYLLLLNVVLAFLVQNFLGILSYLSKVRLSFFLNSKFATGPPLLAI